MRHHRLLVLTAFLFALPAAAEIPLQSVRVSLPAEVRSQGQTTTLEKDATVDEGDRVITGDGGRVSLQFAGQSMIMLGENSELYIHSADPPDVGQGAVMRLQLVHGDLQVDARPTDNALPQDFRLNIGSLSARVLGGHIWSTADSKGETLCLLDGAAEIDNGEDHHRLDGRNDCLGHRLDSGEVRIMTSTPEVMRALLARTTFDSSKDIASSALPQHLAMAPSNRPKASTQAARASGAPAATPAPPVAATKPAPVATENEGAAAQSTDGWTVVVASLADPEAAERMKKKLAREGMPSGLQISAADATRQQVTIGHYKTQAEARRQAARLKARYKGAWVTHRTSAE